MQTLTERPFAELIPGQGYRVGERLLPRVSTILGQLDKPELDEWRVRVGPVVSQRIMEKGRDFGTRVHAAADVINRGEPWQPGPNDGDIIAHVQGYADWLGEHVAEVEATEQIVYSLRWGYGGTVDLVARMVDGRRLLLDLKTSKRISHEYRLQTAAYVCAIDEMGLPPVDGRGVIHIPSDRRGKAKLVMFDNDKTDELTWRCLLQIYRWANTGPSR